MRSLAILIAASGFAAGAAAQMNTGATADPSVTVIDVSRAQNRIVVQDAAGQQRTLLLNDQTRFERQGAPGTPGTAMRIDDVVVGDRLLVGDPTQRGFTRRVQVLPPGAVSAPGQPGTVRPGANPAAPPTGVNRPGSADPANPPAGVGRPGTTRPPSASDVNRPGVANPAAPQAPGGAGTGSGGSGGGSGGSGGGGGGM
jgi:hypothetical protein